MRPTVLMQSLYRFLTVVMALFFLLAGVGMVSAAECEEEGEDVEELPGSNIEAVYQVAGTLSQGSFVSNVGVQSSFYGNASGTSAYTSKLHGKGGVQFVSTTLASRDTVVGELAAMLGDGRVYGKSSAFITQVNPGEMEEPEELGPEETCIAACVFNDPDPEELDWIYPPFCEDAISVNQFDITSGQAGIMSSVSMPSPSTLISQSLAVQGNGWAKSSGGYLYMEGTNATMSGLKSSKAFTQIHGRDLTFASQFNYTAIRG